MFLSFGNGHILSPHAVLEELDQYGFAGSLSKKLYAVYPVVDDIVCHSI